jgi:hypothetical protein
VLFCNTVGSTNPTIAPTWGARAPPSELSSTSSLAPQRSTTRSTRWSHWSAAQGLQSLAEARRWIATSFDILGNNIWVRCHFLEDFLIIFSFVDDMLCVLDDPPPTDTPFTLIFKRWHRKAMASVESLRYQVTVVVCHLPAHVWNLTIVQHVLSPTCSRLKPTSETVAKVDLCCFMVVAWCIHPNLIPREKIIFVSELPVSVDGSPPMFVRPEDVIHHSHLMLRYQVLIDVLEVTDWHVPLDSSDGGLNSDDRNSWLHPWPKCTCFSDGLPPSGVAGGNVDGDPPLVDPSSKGVHRMDWHTRRRVRASRSVIWSFCGW